MSQTHNPGDAGPPQDDANNPRRNFMKVMATAVAGLGIAGRSDAAAARTPDLAEPRPGRKNVDEATQRRLAERLEAYAAALSARDLGALRSFFSPTIDFRSSGAIMRSLSELEAELANDRLLSMRANASITHVKWLSTGVAIVDGNFPSDGGRGWFTEVWRGPEMFTIDVTRLRSGPAEAGFRALDATPTGVVPGDLSPEVASYEEGLLREKFRTFRAAFNAGDIKGVMALTTGTINAIPVFSFLEGRAQILETVETVEEKAARMMGGTTTTLSATSGIRATAFAQRATYVAGEPKVIRFLSPTLAIVDGTAQIGNIPSAHEFSPQEMRGIYSTIWSKAGSDWKAEATRPWF